MPMLPWEAGSRPPSPPPATPHSDCYWGRLASCGAVKTLTLALRDDVGVKETRSWVTGQIKARRPDGTPARADPYLLQL